MRSGGIENFNQILNILKRTDKQSIGYKQGVHWVIRDINKNGAIFKGKKLKFEHSIPNARPTTGNSSIDLFCANCNPPNLKVEYKSGPGSINTTANLNKNTIKKQFIERDLFNAKNLDEIQWRMEGTGFTKEKLIQELTKNKKSIEDLGFEKIKAFFPKDLSINRNNFTKKFIEKFEESNSLYQKIFK